MNYTKEEIVPVLKFVEEKVNQYLNVVNDTNLDYWSLDCNSEGVCLYISTSTTCCGDTDYKSYSLTFEKLLATTEEQVRIVEAERKAEIERKKQLEAERQIQRDLERQQRDLERQQRDYEEYLRLKSKYEK